MNLQIREINKEVYFKYHKHLSNRSIISFYRHLLKATEDKSQLSLTLKIKDQLIKDKFDLKLLILFKIINILLL
jgi:hypothetical protein